MKTISRISEVLIACMVCGGTGCHSASHKPPAATRAAERGDKANPAFDFDMFKPWDSVPVVVSVSPSTVTGGGATNVIVDSLDDGWTAGTYFVQYSVVGDPNPDAWKSLLRDPPTTFWSNDRDNSRFQLRTATVLAQKQVRITIIGSGEPKLTTLTINP